jgi:hypothetical protein
MSFGLRWCFSTVALWTVLRGKLGTRGGVEQEATQSVRMAMIVSFMNGLWLCGSVSLEVALNSGLELLPFLKRL